uniref:Uncharacterized protein n=1 Tax=Strigamia maritima TaxID=126957 RepID=T1JE36_STRMM
MLFSNSSSIVLSLIYSSKQEGQLCSPFTSIVNNSKFKLMFEKGQNRSTGILGIRHKGHIICTFVDHSSLQFIS